MWMRTLHKIFIGGEVIRNERTPFLARWEKSTVEGNTEQIRHYWKKKILHWIYIFIQWSLCCHVAFKQRWWWFKTSFAPTRCGFLWTPDIERPWQLAEMNDCEQTALPNYWHLWNVEKIIFENWIIIKPMSHSDQAAHRPGSSRSKYIAGV